MITQSLLLNDLSLPLNQIGRPLTFAKVIEEFSYKGEKYIRDKIKEYLEYVDYVFRYSDSRTSMYYVKYTKPRTIITMFGEITYTRTIYKDLLTNRNFCYVDEKLGIDKRIRYTNDVAAYVIEAYSDENSMIKVGNEIGNLIHSKFSLKDNRDYALPRQTIYNLLKRTKQIRINPLKEKMVIDELFLLMDEKYLPDHPIKNDDSISIRNPTMVKSALIVEGLDKTSKKRHSYINPQYYSSYGSNDFSSELLEYLDNRYDLEKLKVLNVLADGANWIKAVASDMKLPGIKTKQYLDKFHFHQALWRICKEEEIYKKAVDYLYHNDKENLYELLNLLNKSDNDLKNINYIKNNYQLIQNTIHSKNMNCAMEQAISHHIHSQFDNVPKVYSKANIDRYLSYRDNYRNKENMKLLFLEALKDKSDSDKTIINKTKFNLSSLENKADIPYYTTALNSGKKPVIFKPHDDYRFIF